MKINRQTVKNLTFLTFYIFVQIIFAVSCKLVSVTADRIIFEDNNQLTQNFEWLSYTVEQGDSISSIARKFNISLEAVIICNNIPNARELHEGKELRIPNMDGLGYTVKARDTIYKISKKYRVAEKLIRDANNINDGTLKEGDALFIPGAYTNNNPKSD